MTKYIHIGYTYEEITVIDPQQYNTKKNKQYNKTKKLNKAEKIIGYAMNVVDL